MIDFRGVSKQYEGHNALNSVNINIERGEMVFITGPSGAGKSTLLKLIYLAERPDEGRLTINNIDVRVIHERDIPYMRRNIGVVFQDFRLLENRTIFDNIAIALRIRGIPEKEIKDLVHEILRMVNLRHKTDSYPPMLSGGEQQRIVIARAIIGEPIILLADEPTGNLDPDTAMGIMRIFKEINARGTTMIIATHNKDLYLHTGMRVLRLENGQIVTEVLG